MLSNTEITNNILNNRKEELLNGTLSIPSKLQSIVKANDTEFSLVKKFWNAIWYNYLSEKPVDTYYWYEQFEHLAPSLFNKVIYTLEHFNWIKSNIERNYAFIELNEAKLLKWVNKEDLINIKREFKYKKYEFKYEWSDVNDLVKQNNEYRRTGLIRKGFCEAGNNVFTYDTKYLNLYRDDIARTIEKGLEPSEKDISYQEIIRHLVRFHADRDNYYSLNQCIIDSRGRAIHQCLKKILNPISCKPARALIVTHPIQLDYNSEIQIYLFISELLGYRPNTMDEKAELGFQAYHNRTLPEYSLDNLEEYIWLSRIYDGLANHHNEFTVPVELDMIASIIEIMGILTNCHEYLVQTNLAKNDHDELHDIWTIPNIPRTLVKKAMTPLLYGSSANISTIWDKHHFQYTKDHLILLKKEIYSGRFRVADEFKNFLINNAIMKPEMDIEILDDKFKIYCNKFKWNETTEKRYNIVANQRIRSITRNVELVPDLERFKVYTPTLLCHNLDSQLANFICEHVNWILPIHDAFVVKADDALTVRGLFKHKMTEIYQNRHEILSKFCKCINISKQFKDIDKGELPLSSNALK